MDFTSGEKYGDAYIKGYALHAFTPKSPTMLEYTSTSWCAQRRTRHHPCCCGGPCNKHIFVVWRIHECRCRNMQPCLVPPTPIDGKYSLTGSCHYFFTSSTKYGVAQYMDIIEWCSEILLFNVVRMGATNTSHARRSIEWTTELLDQAIILCLLLLCATNFYIVRCECDASVSTHSLLLSGTTKFLHGVKKVTAQQTAKWVSYLF